MVKKELISVINRSGIAVVSGETERGKYLNISCPFAPWTHDKKMDKHPSMSIKCQEGPSTYFCYSCHERGALWQLFRSLGAHKKDTKLMDLGSEILKLEFNPEARLDKALASYDFIGEDKEEPLDMTGLFFWYEGLPEKGSKEFVHYMSETRGIRFIEAQETRLKDDMKERRVLFPMYDSEGLFIGLVGRQYKGDDIKYKNYWGTQVWRCLGRAEGKLTFKKVILVEGFFDLLRTRQNLRALGLLGEYEVFCTFTARQSKEQIRQLEEYGCPVFCLYDNDKAGRQGWSELVHGCNYHDGLKGKIPRLIRMEPPEDKDAGELLATELARLIKKGERV